VSDWVEQVTAWERHVTRRAEDLGLTAAQIAAMPMDEYAKVRGRLLGTDPAPGTQLKLWGVADLVDQARKAE
jgi:hypothetical protein